MTRLPWETSGARLQLPRDLHVAYTVGRMGVATVAHLAPLFWGSPVTARFGFGRLLKLGLLRTFPREDVARPAWYALDRDAAGWVADQMECEETELRVTTGIRRMNLLAADARNRLWASFALACRATGDARQLALFRPEWELRRMKPPDVPVVPDAQAVIVTRGEAGEREAVVFIELDAGTERLRIWREKAAAYASLRGGPLYGASNWSVLAAVPSVRRARTVATAVTEGGGGAFTLLAVTESLMEGLALERALWPAAELAASKDCAASEALCP